MHLAKRRRNTKISLLPALIEMCGGVGTCVHKHGPYKEDVKHDKRSKFLMVFCSGRLLCATPGILLHDYELQDEFGCATRPLHHHRVATVIQQLHPAPRHRLCYDCGPRDIHHLEKFGTYHVCGDETELSQSHHLSFTSYTAAKPPGANNSIELS